MLKTIKLGDSDITRLIIGGNPISGNSHMSVELDEEMESYYTVENIKKTLFRCEESGINTMTLRSDKHIFRLMKEYRNEGGKLQWIAQTVPETAPFESNVRMIMKNDPVAIFHHGTVTDALFKAGEYDELKRRIEILRKTGKPAGLCTHMPQVIEYAEEHKWNADFYMACVYNLSRVDRVSSAITGVSNTEEPFFEEDRPLMYKMIRSVNKPCLAFKILGAGRRCQSADTVKAAFAEAFANIKPTDAVVVGMFPKYSDQMYDNARTVEEILKQH
jgi:hypothetical protein